MCRSPEKGVKPNKDKRQGKDARMKTKKIRFAGPSKKMMAALEKEGLNVCWPSEVHDEEQLAFDATFCTGADWEKSLCIDLRDTPALDTKSGVDKAVAAELQEEYDNFDIDEQMYLNLQGSPSERESRGVPNAARLLEDMQEQEKRLERFAEVAEAVADGREIPAAEDTAKVTISGPDAKRVAALLMKIARLMKYTHSFSEEEKAEAMGLGEKIFNLIKED